MISGILLEPKRFAVHDGPGVRTTFFFKGCPLRCIWCHNPEAISPQAQMACYAHKCINCGQCVSACKAGAQRFDGGVHHFDVRKCRVCGDCEAGCLGAAMKLYGRQVSIEEAVAMALPDKSFYDESGGGVTLSGGEPLMQCDFAVGLLSELKRNGIHTALDTCAFAPEAAIARTLPFTDLYLVDFKHSDCETHRRLTGQPNGPILENLRFLSSHGARIEIRIPLVPGCNDSDVNMAGTGRFLSSLEGIDCVKLLPYHSLARGKYAALGMEDTMPAADSPAEAAIQHAASILRGFGLNAHSGRE